MAIISASFYSPATDASPIKVAATDVKPLGSGGEGIFTFDLFRTTTEAAPAAVTILYRGFSGGVYVYSYDTPPVGATDIVIMSIVG